MKIIWFLAGTVIIAVGIVATRKLLRENKTAARLPDSDRQLGETGVVVLEAFEADWAKRFGVTKQELRAAVLEGGHSALATRIDDEIGVVDLKFDTTGQQRGNVAVTIIVTYPENQATATAQMTLPWDHVPDGVRAELLRSSNKVVFRKWRAKPGQQVRS